MKGIYQYLRMLLLLSEADLKEFGKFLNSDYHCSNQAARRLFGYLYPTYLPDVNFLKNLMRRTQIELVNSPFLDKELLFYQAFKEPSHGKYARLDTLMTHSKELLEQFLIFEALKHDSYLQNLYLLRALKMREGFDVFFEAKMRKVQETMNEVPAISIKQLLFKFWYDEINYAYQITHDKREAETTNSFFEVLTSFNKYIGAIYLKYSAEILNRAQIFAGQQKVKEFHPLFLLPQVLWLIGRRATFLSTPVVNLYYNLIKCLTSPHKIKEAKEKGNLKEVSQLEKKENRYYFHLKEELSKQIIQAPPRMNDSEKEANTLKIDLVNVNDAGCNYLARRAKENRDNEPLNIAEEIFSLRLLEVKHHLSAVTPNRYMGFVKTVLKMETSQKQIILATYKAENWGKISEIEKKQLRPFIEGLRIVYDNHSMDNITSVIRVLENSSLVEIMGELSRRVLLLQLHYKAQNFVEVQMSAANFRNFLITHDELSPIRANMHRYFINSLSKLTNLKQLSLLKGNINQKQQKAIQAIKGCKPSPIEGEWLIQEFNAL